ncbi:MAG: iron ABC transporter permease [Candidatus Brocadiia bacterium]
MGQRITPSRFTVIIALLAAAAVVSMAACLFIGAADISVARVWNALLGEGSDADRAIVFSRLARGFAALIAGGALSLAGAVSQTVLRNPLADPYVLGISGSAGLGAILAGLIAGSTASASMSLFALPAAVFAVGAVALILAVQARFPRLGLEGLILLGVMINAFCGAAIVAATAMFNQNELMTYFRWMLGSLSVIPYGPGDLLPVGGLTLLVLVILMLLSRRMNALLLRPDEARSMGVEVEKLQRLSLFACAIATAGAVALAGMVGFVGLLIPHAARRLFGGDMRLLLPASALLGGAALVIADAVARSIMRPSELPVGVITAVVGAPALVFILISRSKGGER